MDNKIQLEQLTPEERERLNNSLKRIVEAYSNINPIVINNFKEISKTIQTINIKIPDLNQILIDYKNLMDSLSESLSSLQNIQFQEFAADISESVNELRNNETNSENDHANLINNVQIDKINVEIHNDNPPKNNLFTIISNLIVVYEFLKIINAPDEAIQIVVDLLKKILNLIN